MASAAPYLSLIRLDLARGAASSAELAAPFGAACWPQTVSASGPAGSLARDVSFCRKYKSSGHSRELGRSLQTCARSQQRQMVAVVGGQKLML